MKKRTSILFAALVITVCAKAQTVINPKGTRLTADTTNDLWKQDAGNSQVQLAYLSDGSTARSAGTEFVIKDDGKIGIGTAAPSWLLDVQGLDAIGQFKRINSASSNTGAGFLFTRARGSAGAESNISAGDVLGKVQFRGANRWFG